MSKRRVLLVGWDAADWKIIDPLVERGHMPALAGLIDRGVMGDLQTLHPVLSPMLWNSIATGKRADEHGILGFTEVDGATGGVRPVTSTSRRVKALWNILSQEGLRTNLVGWFGSHPAEPIRGACVSDAIARGTPDSDLVPGTVWPERLADTLRELRIAPEEIDESVLRAFVPRLREIDPAKPNMLGAVSKILAECFTTHAAVTHIMEHEPWDFMAVYYIGIDHFSHGFINYHAPKPDWVSDADFELYRDVVNGGYRLMDLFLARLMYLAGPDTTVLLVSDHGFHSDHLRPVELPHIPAGPTAQHRDLGVITMAGPGIRRDERIYGAGLLDIAPTVLALFGLPAGADMPGRVLAEAFEDAPESARIPSWELVYGEAGMHPPGYTMPPGDAGLLLRQFVDLGYIDEPSCDRTRAVVECERERDWNLARVYMSSFRPDEALPVLERICADAPERSDFALALAEVQRRLGLREEAAATVAGAIADHRDKPAAHLILGRIAFENGDTDEALRELLLAESVETCAPHLQNAIGFAYLRQRKWADADRAFQRAIGIDPNSPAAWQGLAAAFLRQGRCEDAARAALASVGFQHGAPRAHFILGAALLRLGQRVRAVQAFETCLTLQPPLQAAHRVLARIHPDATRAAEHLRLSREFARHRRAEERRLEAIRQTARHRAIDRAEQRRRAPVVAPEQTTPAEFVIVSGLPRSGTSLMMQMLAAAGLPAMTDGQRLADSDNPEGYYEWERIRQMGRRPEILGEAQGKVVKVVAPLLRELPATHSYRVIFMDRPISEVAESQRRMIQNRGGAARSEDPGSMKMRQLMEAFRASTLAFIERDSRFDCLVVNYPELVENPERWTHRISGFLNHRVEAGAMAAVVRPELYRNRICA